MLFGTLANCMKITTLKYLMLSWSILKQLTYVVSLYKKVSIKIFKDYKYRISVVQIHDMIFMGLETVSDNNFNAT